MPLYKRKPFTLSENPNDLMPQELVFQVRFTKEIFRDYRYKNHDFSSSSFLFIYFIYLIDWFIVFIILFYFSLIYYSEYLNRINLYRQRVWTCKVTGKTNLTFEEALVSEQKAIEKVQQFPQELVAPVLRHVQFSMY